jgi:hypothetical protein
LSDRQVRTERQRYIAKVRRSVSCITPVVVLAAPLDTSNIWQAWMATDPTPLPSAPNLTVQLVQDFQHHRETGTGYIHSSQVSYRYVLSEINGREIFAYHYHPKGTSPIKYPHIHVGTNDPRLDHGKTHLPTGIVTLEQIIHCLITEFEIPPLRQDWGDILAAGPGTVQSSTPI